MKLNNLKCEKAKPAAKPYRLTDGGGLRLLVMPTGAKLWRWKYRFEGKEKQMALGKYPEVPLAQARMLHAAARAKLANGNDPMTERKENKEQQKAELDEGKKAATLTYGSLVRQWFNWWGKNKNPKYALQVENLIEKYIIATLGKKLPAQITRLEIIAIVHAVDESGTRETARRILQFISQIFVFGCDRGLILSTPAAGIKPSNILSQPIDHGGRAHLPIAEVPELLAKMDEYDGNVLTRIAMHLLSLTFLRTRELLDAQWNEIDWEQKQWRIPPERMKMKRPHIVPLAKQTVGLLKRLHNLTGEGEWLFPNTRGDTKSMTRGTFLYALKRMGYKGRMTGHGWRAIASTWLHEHGFTHEHIELQLAHSSNDKVSAAYNFAKYLADRTVMMQAWADALDEMRNKGEHRLQVVA